MLGKFIEPDDLGIVNSVLNDMNPKVFCLTFWGKFNGRTQIFFAYNGQNSQPILSTLLNLPILISLFYLKKS